MRLPLDPLASTPFTRSIFNVPFRTAAQLAEESQHRGPSDAITRHRRCSGFVHYEVLGSPASSSNLESRRSLAGWMSSIMIPSGSRT